MGAEVCVCSCHPEPIRLTDSVGSLTACRRCAQTHMPLHFIKRDPRDRIEPTSWNPEDDGVT